MENVSKPTRYYTFVLMSGLLELLQETFEKITTLELFIIYYNLNSNVLHLALHEKSVFLDLSRYQNDSD